MIKLIDILKENKKFLTAQEVVIAISKDPNYPMDKNYIEYYKKFMENPINYKDKFTSDDEAIQAFSNYLAK